MIIKERKGKKKMAIQGMNEVDKWLTDDGLLLLAAFARDGMTTQEIADKIGVTKRTLDRWKNEYPEIDEAVNTSKELVDYKVENALLKSALGYTAKESKVIMRLRNGKMTTVEQETVIKEIPPDVRAITLWLNNRQTKKWRRNADNIVDGNEEDTNITVNIIRHGEKKKVTPNENQTDNDDWNADEEWEEESTKSGNDESSNSGIEININVRKEPEVEDDWDDDDWDSEEVEPIEVEPIKVQKELQVKNTDTKWKETGRYNDKGIIKQKEKKSLSLNDLAEQSSSIEEDDWDED
jgi:transcriptional regulator with XRE-family HTH domain